MNEDHVCTDFDWYNPDIHSDDPEDEVLACTECGRVKWTAREIHKFPYTKEQLREMEGDRP